MASAVARAMSVPPGTIHGSAETPLGTVMMHSVIAFHSARVTMRASAGSTPVIATTAQGCAW